MDNVAKSKRSDIMRQIKSEGTKPELIVRSMTHRLGYRFRLYREDLPGKPDMVFPSRRKIIFIHGCFWHGHDCYRGCRIPKTNTDYWIAKIEKNKRRDKENQIKLKKLGWETLVIWECQVKKKDELKSIIINFLESPNLTRSH